MGADAIEVLRDRKLAFPEAANSRLKAIRAVFKWAVRKKGPDGKPLVSNNPARDVTYLKSNNPSGYHTWTLEEVRQFEAASPDRNESDGLRSRSCSSLDNGGPTSRALVASTFGTARLTFTQFKGRNRKPKQARPADPAGAATGNRRLADAVISTFLVNDLGRPFTDAGFGNKFRDVVRPSRASPLHRARLAQSRCDHRSKQRRDRASTHGDLRLGHAQNGRSLHTRRRSRTAGRSPQCTCSKRQNKTAQNRVPPKMPGGTFSEKTPAKSKVKSWGWCPWRESNPHSLRNTILSRARLPVPPHGHRGCSITSNAFRAKGKIEARVPRASGGKAAAT